MSIIIDPEFQSLIPPLTTEEYTQLEKNIIKDGIRDALIVWSQGDGNDILIDGHNRFQISCAHAGIRFEIKRKEFNDREEVKRWIILNQFGRRNLSAYDRSVLALKLKPMIAERAKEKQSEAGGAVRQKSDKAVINTKKELAKAAGVSHDTIYKVETIEKKAPESLREQARSGVKTINQAFNELKELERKQTDLSAKAHLKAVTERHKAFQSSGTVTMDDARQDRKDVKEIASAKIREIRNALKSIVFIGATLHGNDFDLTMIGNADKKETDNLLQDLNLAVEIIGEIKGAVLSKS